MTRPRPIRGRRLDQAHNVAGVTPESVQVPAEAQRIVVLSGDQLDALCALGLQSRVIAAALPDGSSSQPSYLGDAVHALPGVGTRSNPDLRGIAALHPDLILGSVALTPRMYPKLAAIAPTVFTGAPGAAWEDNLRIVGAATARSGAVDGLIDGFTQRAGQIGASHDAAHFQASVVQLTDNSLRVYGANNFPASVLSAVGVDRPCRPAVHRQAVHRDRRHRRRPGEGAGFLRGRRRRHLHVVRHPRRRRTAPPRSWTAPRGASCPPTATTGFTSSTTRYGRPARA